MSESNQHNHIDRFQLGAGPDRRGSLIDIAIYLGAGLGFFLIEELLREYNLFPYPGLFDGALSLILSFFVVAGIMKWRGQSWGDFGLRRPERKRTIPLWGFVVLLVNIVAQLTIVPLLAMLFNLPAPDFSRYDVLTGNLGLFITVVIGAMITGGFIEEFIYRGLMVDRLARIFGGGKRGFILAAGASGIPFGLIHFEWGIGGMFTTAVMGGVLGYMYLATKRNLWPLIAAHATLDLILLWQMYLGVLS